jgi:hypothetical protein
MERRLEQRGDARVRQPRERLSRRPRQRIEHVDVAFRRVADVVEKRAELGAGQLGGGIGHVLHDRFAIERRRHGNANIAQLLHVGGVLPRLRE